jgi:4-alpha-glucanotransferase
VRDGVFDFQFTCCDASIDLVSLLLLLAQMPVITGLRIQRMPAEKGVKFGDPLAYPYMTVASPSSHDTSTTRGWWEHEVQQRQEFFAEVRPAMADALCAPGTLMSFLVANAS